MDNSGELREAALRAIVEGMTALISVIASLQLVLDRMVLLVEELHKLVLE